MNQDHSVIFKTASKYYISDHYFTKLKERCPFLYRGLNTKTGSQEIPGVTGKFGLGVQNEAGQGLTEFHKRMHLT